MPMHLEGHIDSLLRLVERDSFTVTSILRTVWHLFPFGDCTDSSPLEVREGGRMVTYSPPEHTEIIWIRPRSSLDGCEQLRELLGG